MVTGYQGGELNPLDGYMTVRQSDAHAWAEVWLEGAGWRTLDPTAAVAPSRIESGVMDALGEDERDLVGQSRWSNSLAHSLYRQWDALGYSWNRWVLNYDRDSQQNLFSNLLGNNSPWRIGFTVAGLSVGLFLLYAFAQTLGQARRAARPEDLWIRPLLRRAARRGFVRQPKETLAQFAMRVNAVEPALGDQLVLVANLYTASVYADDPAARARLRSIARGAQPLLRSPSSEQPASK